jgi:hypothetical protein
MRPHVYVFVCCRAVQPALVPEDAAFPQLDFVCISHNHYDHLDTGQAPGAAPHCTAQHSTAQHEKLVSTAQPLHFSSWDLLRLRACGNAGRASCPCSAVAVGMDAQKGNQATAGAADFLCMRTQCKQQPSTKDVMCAGAVACTGSVARLYKRFGDQLCWYVPLGLKAWFTGRGISNVQELDWWQEAQHPGSKVRRNRSLRLCEHRTQQLLSGGVGPMKLHRPGPQWLTVTTRSVLLEATSSSVSNAAQCIQWFRCAQCVVSLKTSSPPCSMEEKRQPCSAVVVPHCSVNTHSHA